MVVWTSGATGAPPYLEGFAGTSDTAFDPASYTAYTDFAALDALTAGAADPDVGESFAYDVNTQCFIAGTRITMVDGSALPVENVTVGMLVADGSPAQSPSASALGFRRVVETRSQPTSKLVFFKAGCLSNAQNQSLYVTPRHLIFSAQENMWLEAMCVPGGSMQTFSEPVQVHHLVTSEWGGLLAEGVPCETAAVTSEHKKARCAANRFAREDIISS